jgi:hypothetical protein
MAWRMVGGDCEMSNASVCVSSKVGLKDFLLAD